MLRGKVSERPVASKFAATAILSLLSSIGCTTAPAPVAPAKSDASVTEVSAGPVCPIEMDDLISDFTMDSGVHQADGRQGGWFTYADKSGLGTLMPPEGAGMVPPDSTVGNDNCASPGSLHVSAVNFTDWGAAMGTDFMAKVVTDAGAMAKGTYDASRYRGISFWAKATAPVRFVQVKLIDPYTDIGSPLAPEEQCIYVPVLPNMPADPRNCSPYLVKFGYGNVGDPTVATDFPRYTDYKLDVAWKRFEVLFADTKQDRYNLGRKSPGDKLDVGHLIGMAIQVNSDHATTPPTPNNFEIWIDDVTFVR